MDRARMMNMQKLELKLYIKQTANQQSRLK